MTHDKNLLASMNHIRKIFNLSVFECFVLLQLKKEKKINGGIIINVTKPTFPFSSKGEQKNGKRMIYAVMGRKQTI